MGTDAIGNVTNKVDSTTAKPQVRRQSPSEKTGDSTKQDKRPPKRDTYTKSQKGDDEEAHAYDQHGKVSDSFQGSAEEQGGANVEPAQGLPERVSDVATIYNRKGKIITLEGEEDTPKNDDHPKLDEIS